MGPEKSQQNREHIIGVDAAQNSLLELLLDSDVETWDRSLGKCNFSSDSFLMG